jgi:uncharacterized protein
MSSQRGQSVEESTTELGESRVRNVAVRHPVGFFFVASYAIAWPFFLASHLVGDPFRTVLMVIGGFGPATAAAWAIRLRRGSLSEWGRAIIRWRVSPLAYLYALGLPVLLAAGLNAALMVLGHQVEWGLAPERAPAYLLTFLLTAVIFGGQEEPGWRGYALGELQRRRSPLVATLAGSWLGHLARSPLRAGRLCGAASARLPLHLPLQHHGQRAAVHHAACRIDRCPRSSAADR